MEIYQLSDDNNDNNAVIIASVNLSQLEGN